MPEVLESSEFKNSGVDVYLFIKIYACMYHCGIFMLCGLLLSFLPDCKFLVSISHILVLFFNPQNLLQLLQWHRCSITVPHWMSSE